MAMVKFRFADGGNDFYLRADRIVSLRWDGENRMQTCLTLEGVNWETENGVVSVPEVWVEGDMDTLARRINEVTNENS